MARWTPGSRGRLQAAAFELFSEKGYEKTTVGDIAAAAGVTERTFYRYFSDRREVFFDGAQELQNLLVSAIEASPAEVGPLDAVIGALCQAARDFFEERMTFARQRQRIIDATPELYERELAKMSRLSVAAGAALRSRGVEECAADVAAETGIAVFRVAFAHWVDQENAVSLEGLIIAALDQLREMTPHAVN